MKHYLHIASVLFFGSSFILPPFPASPSFIEAMECPATNSLAEYLTDQVDVRAQAIPQADREASMEIFSSKDILTGEGYIYNENNWLRQDLGAQYQPLDLSGTSVWGSQLAARNPSEAHRYPGSLVTPQHVVMSGHARPTSGTITFYDHNNVPHVRTIVNSKGVRVYDESHYERSRPTRSSGTSDIVIQELNEPLPDSVHVYKIISHNDLTQYIDKEKAYEQYSNNGLVSLGIPAINFNQFDLAGTRDVSNIGHGIAYGFNSFSATEAFSVGFQLPREDRARSDFQNGMINGDSGDGAFFIFDNELTLLMTNLSQGGGPMHGGYIEVMNDIISDWGSDYRIEEPDLGCFEKRNTSPRIEAAQDLYIKSETEVGASFGRIDVSDEEDGSDLERFILWGNGKIRDNFILNKDSGLLSVAGRIEDLDSLFAISDTVSEISFNKGEIYNLELVTQDNNSVRASGRGNIRVHVVEDNSSPVIIPSNTQQPLRVRSGLTSGAPVTQVKAEDPDGDTFVWSIESSQCSGSGKDSPFDIIPETGEIIISQDPERQAFLSESVNSECTLEIMVSDSGVPTRVSSYEMDVVISSDTEINRSPVIEDQVIGVLSEASAYIFSVGTVDASDPDFSQSLTYEIISSDDGDLFTIDATTGLVRIKDTSHVDYETKTEYVFEVRVTDDYERAGFEKSASAFITLEIKDADEGLQLNGQKERGLAIVFIPENSTEGRAFRLEDPDTDTDVVHSFVEGQGRGANFLTIDPVTGLVSFKDPIDFEEDFKQNSLEDRADDHPDSRIFNPRITGEDGVNDIFNLSISVLLFDLDEGKYFVQDAYSINSVDDSILLLTETTDPVEASTVVPRIPFQEIFEITGGEHAGLFDLDSKKGILTFKEGEGNFGDTYEVEVTIKDALYENIETYHYFNVDTLGERILIPAVDEQADSDFLKRTGLNQSDIDSLMPGLTVQPEEIKITQDELERYQAVQLITITLDESSDSEISSVLPVVSAGVDKDITLPTSSTIFTGTAADSDGTIVSEVWTQNSGPTTATLSGETTSTLSVVGLIEGTYVFTFTATDDGGGSTSDSAQVAVSAAVVVSSGGGGGSSRSNDEEGCTDENALNYDDDADDDDGSCEYSEDTVDAIIASDEDIEIVKAQLKVLLRQLLGVLKDQLKELLLERGYDPDEYLSS